MAPTRTCVGCRKALPVDVLFRVVRGADGALRMDRNAAGRGAWLCRDSPACLEAAASRRGFERAFKTPVPSGEVAHLRERLESASEQPAPDVRG